MKKILFILLMAIASNAYAAIDCVVVYDKNDQKNIIPIKDASEISFDGNIISIGSYYFNMELLKRYEFADSKTMGVEDIDSEMQGLKIDPNGLITFDGTLKDSDIEVWDMKGIRHPYKLIGNTVDICNLPSDTYVVKIGQKTFKFQKL